MSTIKQGAFGIIGGSGLYNIEGIKVEEEVEVETPYGMPSDKYVVGTLEGVKVVFLPRHGVGHRFLPSEVNYRANIWGMKKLGVTQIIAVSAVGSLREGIKPGHIVIPDQVIDKTRGRKSTYFGNGIVGHVMFADPYCNSLRNLVKEAAEKAKATVHWGGTLVCMEGPQFSTRAESNLHREIGADIIGMTVMPEAKLAREAEICYSTLALSTDYDCWREETEDVSVEAVIKIIKENVELSKLILKNIISSGDYKCLNACHQASQYAIMTASEVIPEELKKKTELLFGKYLD